MSDETAHTPSEPTAPPAQLPQGIHPDTPKPSILPTWRHPEAPRTPVPAVREQSGDS